MAMESAAPILDFHAARALLAWQLELGADEPVGDAPINRYELAPTAPKVARLPEPAAEETVGVDPVAVAEQSVVGVTTLEDLARVQAAFDLCEMKKGARNFVFADGNPKARVMIIGEAPGREEDLEARPFVGVAGQLLDRMFAAIGLARGASDPQAAFYITNVMPWRPPSNRDPEPAEIAMMLPFLRKHVELVAPEVIVLMGNTPCAAVLGTRGILRLRGTWATGFGRPVMPMTHPAYLLRTPAAKREAWADLLAIKSRLNGGT
jgi:uracil-DNA glycosylase